MTAIISKLKSKADVQQLPVTHERAVRDDNGTTLETKLQMIDSHYNKDYEVGNGMGKKTLPKNNGVLTQEMMPLDTGQNTIYVIQYDYTLGEDITVPENCVLEFDGGSISGAYTLTGNNTFIDSNTLCIKKDVIIGGTWGNETIYTRWLEFVSADDGTTDNVLQFKQLQNMINGTKGCKVEFEQGYYQSQIKRMDSGERVTIDGTEYVLWTNEYPESEHDGECILNVRDIPYVNINLNGSTIQKINVTNPRSNTIQFLNVNSACIHDGTFIGMAINNFSYPLWANRRWVTDHYEYFATDDYEFEFGINQIGGFLVVKNMNIQYQNGDGIVAGSFYWYTSDGIVRYESKGYVIKNSEISFCARNGISLHSSYEGQIKNLHIHHIGSDAATGVIGSDGIMGRNPRAGIDVEFEDGLGLTPIMSWDNLYIHDCAVETFGFAGKQYSKMKNFNCTNSIFIGFALLNNLNSETGNNVFDNCYFERCIGSSINGTLLSDGTVFNNCSFIFKADTSTSLGNNQTYNNCTFSDERTEFTNFLFSQNEAKGTVFYNSNFNINGNIGYLGACSKFKECTFNVSVAEQWRVADAEFYNCIFNDKVEESDYTFQFRGGAIDVTTGLKLINCIFDDGKGISSAMDGNFLLVPIVTMENCTFRNSLNLVMWNGYDYKFKDVISSYVYYRPYSPSYGTQEPYKLLLDGCKFEEFDVYVNNDPKYNDSLVIRDSEFKVLTSFSNAVLDGCKINTGTVIGTIYPFTNTRAKNSIIELPSVTSAGSSNFTLENCYVSGVSEANFKGSKTNCTFKYPIPVSGNTSSRPIGSTIYVGFRYMDTEVGKPIYASAISGDTVTWVDALGNPVNTNYQASITGTAGNLAGFDANGKLADSGSKPSDFEPASA